MYSNSPLCTHICNIFRGGHTDPPFPLGIFHTPTHQWQSPYELVMASSSPLPNQDSPEYTTGLGYNHRRFTIHFRRTFESNQFVVWQNRTRGKPDLSRRHVIVVLCRSRRRWTLRHFFVDAEPTLSLTTHVHFPLLLLHSHCHLDQWTLSPDRTARCGFLSSMQSLQHRHLWSDS